MRTLWSLLPLVLAVFMAWLAKIVTRSTWREMWEAVLNVIFGVPECCACGCRTRELYQCETCGSPFCIECFDFAVGECNVCAEKAADGDDGFSS